MEFYVATDGNDRNPGTEDRPFATLVQARDSVRQVQADGPKRIIVRGGIYYDVRLVLGVEDSGLTIEAAEGETVILCGGKPVEEWEKEGEDFCAARLPGVKEGAWDFRLLLVNGRICPRARLPEKGRFKHLNQFKVRWLSTSGGWERKPTETELTTMKYNAKDIGTWVDANNAELTVFHKWDESFVGVKAIDHRTQTITFSDRISYPPGVFGVDSYVVWNLREGMHRPGQWVLDRTAGKLVYWPLEGEDISTLQAVVPTTESVIRNLGNKDRPVTGITVKGLRIQCTTTPLRPGGWAAAHYAGAVHGDHTRDCRFEELHICLVGGQGIFLRNSENPLVDGCEVRATGAGGIYCCGRGGIISNNHVHHVGEVFPSAIGIRVIGRNHIVRHNEIHNTSYCGIEGGSSGARIETNRIYDYMQVLHDGGAIYNSFNGVANPCKDVIIRRNVAFFKSAGPRAQSHAYYLDERSVDCVIEENLALNTSWPCHVHMTEDCTVRDNVFIDEEAATVSFPRSKGARFERNVVYALGQIGKRGENVVWKDNLFFSAKGEYESIPNDQIKADPLFVDWKNGNYNFKAGSPVVKLGIKPIEVSAVGGDLD